MTHKTMPGVLHSYSWWQNQYSRFFTSVRTGMKVRNSSLYNAVKIISILTHSSALHNSEDIVLRSSHPEEEIHAPTPVLKILFNYYQLTTTTQNVILFKKKQNSFPASREYL